MANIFFYEAQFERSLTLLERTNERWRSCFQVEARLAGHDSSRALINGNIGFSAAIHILCLYQQKRWLSHKLDVDYLVETTRALTHGSSTLRNYFQDKNFNATFTTAVRRSMGFEGENLNDEQCKVVEAQKKAPSPEVQKYFLTIYLDLCMSEAKLHSDKSSFASLCFVLVKKLKLPVKNETMIKIIEGANFSKGFLQGTDKARRAQELAALTPQESCKQPAQSAAQSIGVKLS